MKPLHIILAVLGGAVAGAAVGLLLYLHGKRIETTVNHSNSAGDKRSSVADQILDSAAQLFGAAEPLEGSLSDNIGTTLQVQWFRVRCS